MTKDTASPCGKCGKGVPDKAAVCCDGLCNKWYDLKCADLTENDYKLINKLDDKVKWYCSICSVSIGDIMKLKLVQENEEWPSILNIVLDGVRGNSVVTVELEKRVKELEMSEKETKKTLMDLVEKMTGISVVLDINNDKGEKAKPKIVPVSNKVAHKPRHSMSTLKPGTSKIEQANDDLAENGRRLESVIGLVNEDWNSENENSRHRPSVMNYEDVLSEEELEKYNEDFPRMHRPTSQFKEVVYKKKNKPKSDANSTYHKEGHKYNHQIEVHQRGEYRNKSSENRDQRKSWVNAAIIGKRKTVNGLSAAGRNAWLFISRLEPNVKIEALKEYVSSQCDGKEVICEELQTRYQTYKSFKVGCPILYYDKLMDGETWPEGVLVTKYTPKKKYFGSSQEKNSS